MTCRIIYVNTTSRTAYEDHTYVVIITIHKEVCSKKMFYMAYQGWIIPRTNMPQEVVSVMIIKFLQHFILLLRLPFFTQHSINSAFSGNASIWLNFVGRYLSTLSPDCFSCVCVYTFKYLSVNEKVSPPNLYMRTLLTMGEGIQGMTFVSNPPTFTKFITLKL